MQFVTNSTPIKYKNQNQNDLLPKKRVTYKKLCFLTKHRKLNFCMINVHTQSYIALNKYIIGNASIELPKSWQDKSVGN